MSEEASARTSRLLRAGRIHGAVLAPDQAGRVSSRTPRDMHINRRAKRDGVVVSIFETDLLGPTLVHEGKHIEQLRGKAPGREASEYMRRNKDKSEDEAYDYERKNYKKPQ